MPSGRSPRWADPARQRYHPQRRRDAITCLRKKADVLKWGESPVLSPRCPGSQGERSHAARGRRHALAAAAQGGRPLGRPGFVAVPLGRGYVSTERKGRWVKELGRDGEDAASSQDEDMGVTGPY